MDGAVRRDGARGPSGRAVRRLGAALCLAVALALTGCGDGGATGPEDRGQVLTGVWEGGGSFFLNFRWTVTQHVPGDSLTGEGFMDAPNFVDGLPAGPHPRYRIRGERDGLFVRLRFHPDTSGAIPLNFAGVIERRGEIQGEVFTGASNVRLDVVAAFRLPEDSVADGS